MCTHPDNWKLVRRKPEAEDSARENGFDLQGGPAAPWTRGNNCPRVQETDNNGTEQPEERPAPWPQLPDGVEVNEWMHSLKRHERRALMRSLRDKQAKTAAMKCRTGHRAANSHSLYLITTSYSLKNGGVC